MIKKKYTNYTKLKSCRRYHFTHSTRSLRWNNHPQGKGKHLKSELCFWHGQNVFIVTYKELLYGLNKQTPWLRFQSQMAIFALRKL